LQRGLEGGVKLLSNVQHDHCWWLSVVYVNRLVTTGRDLSRYGFFFLSYVENMISAE